MNVAVVGGGLAGLTAAYRLAGVGAHVTVFEAGARWGGQVHTERAGRFVVEHGAEGYAAARTSVRELCINLGRAGRLVSQLTTRTFVLRDGAMVPASLHEAAELAGIQTDRADYGHGLTSLRGGMGELTEALLAALEGRSALRLDAPVAGLARSADGWTLTCAAGEAVAADAVVLATPAAVAARLLEPLTPSAAAVLQSFETLSSVSVSLSCSRRAVAHPLDGSGFVLPGSVEGTGLRACTFVSSKFPARAPRGRVLLRAFFRPGPALQLDRPDEQWVDGAVQWLWPALGVTTPPARAWVARWPHAIARYAPDHADCVARARAILEEETPGLELAGAAYCSAGVAGAIESAEEAVRRLLARGHTPIQRYGSGGSDVS
jgi:oxygen-dependent protoporphyrinogen oxidase